MFNNILSKIKENMQKINKKINLKNIAVITIIIVCFFAFNLSGLLNNVFTSLANLFTNVDGEIKELVIESEKYDIEGGSYKITKKGDWISTTEVQLEYELESIAKDNDISKDIILVLDTSESMDGLKISELKKSTSKLVKSLLMGNDNKIGIISFNTYAQIETNLTNDEQFLLKAIDGMVPKGETSYYQGLLKVNEILKDYVQTSNRELKVIFVTDGSPNIDTPNEIVQYLLLKMKYPYIMIYGINYEAGLGDSINNISDYQYSTSRDLTLDEILTETALSPEYYKTFQLEETINNKYFEASVEDITVSAGDIKILEDNGVQKIVWTSNEEIRSGSKQKLLIKLKVKEDKQKKEGLYNVSTLTEINLVLKGGISHRLSSTKTLKLKSGYKVKYEANAPSGCNASINLEETYYAYDTVKFTNQTLECDGYQFKGWESVQKVKKVNDDNFIMPSNDVIIRGTWSKVTLNKSMQGKIYERLSLYDTIALTSVPDNIRSKFVTSITGINFSSNSSDTNGKGVYTIASTMNDEYPIHYFRGDVDDNNVIFGEYCWKIVRTTKTGGIKMVYNGKPTDGKCMNTTGTVTQIGSSLYNLLTNSPAYVGYAYNKIYSYDKRLFPVFTYGNDVDYIDGEYILKDTKYVANWITNYDKLNDYHYTCFNYSGKCDEVYYVYHTINTHAYYITLINGKKVEDAIDEMLNNDNININNSAIKENIDNWYQNNINYYSYYLEDTVWCNDRTIYKLGGWEANGGSTRDSALYFGVYGRIIKSNPSLSCRKIDSFTTLTNNGNGALNYPVGLLTADEIMYAGGTENSNSSYYLYTNQSYWLSSPYGFLTNNSIYSSNYILTSNGYLSNSDDNSSYGIRPVISLKSGIGYLKGDGSSKYPYVINVDNKKEHY